MGSLWTADPGANEGPAGFSEVTECRGGAASGGSRRPPRQASPWSTEAGPAHTGLSVALAPSGVCPTPTPQEGRRRPALPGGKDAVQVIRFKLKIIKITIQNKKRLSQTNLGQARPATHVRSRGAGHHLGGRAWQEGQEGLRAGWGRALSWSPSAAVSRDARGLGGRGWGPAEGCGGGVRQDVSRGGLGWAFSGRQLIPLLWAASARWTGYRRFIALFWKRHGAKDQRDGRRGGWEAGRRHRLVLASSRTFQITRCMQAPASSLELCPSTAGQMR